MENIPPASAEASAHKASVQHGACSVSGPALSGGPSSVMRKSEILFHAFYFGAFKTKRQIAKAQLEVLGFRFVLLTIGKQSVPIFKGSQEES
jgi:hypothetical protein